jgi:transcription antitermination factor NusG
MVPFQEVEIKMAGKRYPIRRRVPLFPRYVFVRLPEDEEKLHAEYHAMKKINGVVGLLSQSRAEFVPLMLSRDDYDTVRKLSDEGWRTVNLRCGLREGMTVSIQHGPLAGAKGIIDSISRRKINVLLQMLGSQRVVPLDAVDLAVA